MNVNALKFTGIDPRQMHTTTAGAAALVRTYVAADGWINTNIT